MTGEKGRYDCSPADGFWNFCDATVKVNLVGGQKGEFTLAPEDRSVVFLISDKNKQSILATIEKEGHKKELTYALTGLTLEKP